MSGIATAVIGSAVIGGASSYFGAEAQADGLDDSNAISREQMAQDQAQYDQTREDSLAQYDQARADQEPWRTAGANALDRIVDTPDFEFTADTFEQFKDPSYDWRLSEGVDALDASASARGNVFSGGQQKAVAEYGQNMASQEYSNAFNRAKSVYDTNLSADQSLAGVGQSAVNQMQSAGNSYQSALSGASNTLSSANANTANQMSSNAIAGGNNTANMYSNLATSANSAIGNGMLMNALSK